MKGEYLMKGSTGTNTSTIIYIRKSKKGECDCKKCKFGKNLSDNSTYCVITKEFYERKRVCSHYSKIKSRKKRYLKKRYCNCRKCEFGKEITDDSIHCNITGKTHKDKRVCCHYSKIKKN